MKTEHTPAVDYLRLETTVVVTCPDCGQTDCETATVIAERLGKEIVQRQQLEHSLATTFVTWMFSKDPTERSQLWQSMFEIARKLKELNAN